MNNKLKSAVFLLVAAPVSTVFAGSGPGCGWGAQIWKGQSGLSAHTAAATTNGTFANQWFGLTSGTAGCEETSVVQNDAERRMFVANNLDNLAQDVAQGGGEHLAVLAALMGVSQNDEAAFFSVAQLNYSVLFASSDVSEGSMLSELDRALASDPSLAKYVR